MTSVTHDTPAADYHSDTGHSGRIYLSNSIAKILLNQSPLHAWMAHPRLNPNWQADDDSKFSIGTAAHALLLEGTNARIAVIDADDWRTKAAKEARDEAFKNRLTPILRKHNNAVIRMVEAAKSYIRQTEIAGILERGKPEITMRWQEGELWFKSRPDFFTDDGLIMLDYKTTEDASPDAFSRQISRMGYDFQAEFYKRGAAANGYENVTFLILAQETEYPHACSLHAIHESLQEYARMRVERAIAIWRDCLTRNHWPAYPTQICTAMATNWQLAEMERMINETGDWNV